MAPTICFRGDMPRKFHRRCEHSRIHRSQPLPIAADAATPREGEEVPRALEDKSGEVGVVLMSAASSTTSAPVRVTVSPAKPGAASKSTAGSVGKGSRGGGQATPAFLLQKLASARRRRRGAAAAWFQLREANCAASGDDSDLISTTTRHVARQRDEQSRPWAAEWCGSLDDECPPEGCAGRGWRKEEREPKGLLEITVRTVELMRRNQLLQWRLTLLQEETRAFVESVLSNPENRRRDSLGDEEPFPGNQDPAVSGSC